MALSVEFELEEKNLMLDLWNCVFRTVDVFLIN